MHVALAILKFLIRWTLRGVYAVSAIIFLLLAGYWFGWMSVPAHSLNVVTVEFEPVSEPATAPVEQESKRVRKKTTALRRDVENAQARMVRLGRSFITEPDERAAEARAIADIATLDRNEVLSALAALENAPEAGPTFMLRQLLLQRLVDLDPYAALDYVRQKNSRSSRALHRVTVQVLRRWALNDPAAALEAWRGLKLPYLDNANALHEIFRRLGAHDFRRALTDLDTLPRHLQADAWRGLAELAAQEKHRNQAVAALMALPPGGRRTRSLGVALREWAREANPTEALQWLETASLSRDERAQIEEEVGVGFFYQDHQTAADWLIARAQTPTERADRLERVISLWATYDVVAAGQWLIAQGLDDTAAPAMADYARAIATDHPTEAVAWARSIADENVRQRALAQVEKRIRQYYPRRADSLLGPPQ
jgi:hypothetical protein